jgi:hypothetical protein
LLVKPAAAVNVRVLAATHIEAVIERDPAASNGVVLRGILRDDVGAPVPNSHVAISIHHQAGRGPPLPLPLPRAERCSSLLAQGAHDPHIAPDEYVVDTDTSGSFCLRSAIVVERGVVRLRFQGGAFFEASDTDVPFELGRPAMSIAFDPEPLVISLDRPTFAQGLRVARTGFPRSDLHVTLRDERQKVLGAAAFDGDGYARVEFRTEELAGPGTGALSATLDGAPLSLTPATHAIERRARVELDLEQPRPEGYPDDGIPIAVRVSSVRGEVPTGVVEITLGDHPVGAARVQAGKALVLARFGAGRAKTATAQLRYLPDTPWWEPGAPLSLTLHLHPPSPWRRAPLILLALALAAWLAREPLLARMRRPRRAPGRIRLVDERQEMQVLRTRQESGDWAGRVFDAHDGTALAGAKVSVVVPGFPGAGATDDGLVVVIAATTNENGRFVLGTTALRAEARLRIEAPLHATFEQPLPPPAELAVPLVSRRRRLLERLVQWSAREWGKGVLHDPTPAQIIQHAAGIVGAGDLAARERADRVRTWARAVERTAFDRATVDEGAEREVVAREPRPLGSYEDVGGVTSGGPSSPQDAIAGPSSRKS